MDLVVSNVSAVLLRVVVVDYVAAMVELSGTKIGLLDPVFQAEQSDSGFCHGRIP